MEHFHSLVNNIISIHEHRITVLDHLLVQNIFIVLYQTIKAARRRLDLNLGWMEVNCLVDPHNQNYNARPGLLLVATR